MEVLGLSIEKNGLVSALPPLGKKLVRGVFRERAFTPFPVFQKDEEEREKM